ncbi:hypothetical protein [Streptomyces sp. CBMA152]|uniref:hypothetical protein n=1 Tax=Streptomyces sp. CBMA152 TaxID=1896312 RepID=UPI0016610DE7|nr:hypothetical protein [Streptomyces sp. CBMA152]MBD0746702.1 hypothetical protein [Streptomyces sp. CBMA152]
MTERVRTTGTTRSRTLRAAAVGLLALAPLITGAAAASAADASPDGRINYSCGPTISAFATSDPKIVEASRAISGADR